MNYVADASVTSGSDSLYLPQAKKLPETCKSGTSVPRSQAVLGRNYPVE